MPRFYLGGDEMSLTYFAEGIGFWLMLAFFAAAVAAVSLLVRRYRKGSTAGLVALGTGFAALGITVIVLSANLVHSAFSGNEAAMIPRLWSAVLIPAALFLIYRAFRGQEEAPEKAGRLDKVAMVAVALVIAAFLMKYLGYFLCSAAFIFICMYMLDYRKYATMLALSAAWVAFSYFVFYKMLWVTLPLGTVMKAIFKL